MNIVLAGATGNIGSRILDEALRRGHRVTGLSRDPAKLGARDGLQAKKANTTEVAAFADVLKGHDAAILSVKWNENDVHQVLDALRKAGVKRCLFVVGAGQDDVHRVVSLMRSRRAVTVSAGASCGTLWPMRGSRRRE